MTLNGLHVLIWAINKTRDRANKHEGFQNNARTARVMYFNQFGNLISVKDNRECYANKVKQCVCQIVQCWSLYTTSDGNTVISHEEVIKCVR